MSKELTDDDLSLVRNWRTFDNKIKDFTNNINISLFNEIYPKDGVRLINHFVNDCDRNYKKFESYLTREQLNDTLIYILKNY